jgi:LmbE family N-acetylglucosaminyl deacetylase
MQWIYLSPHLDDIALSCGGLVWEQNVHGDSVEIWSICAGDPPLSFLSGFAESLQTRWNLEHDASELRRQEDIASCHLLGAGYRHFPLPDCIYRVGSQGTEFSGKPLYGSEESLWGEIHPAENELVAWLSSELARCLPAECQVVCPLALGGHVDHRLTRKAIEKTGRALWYYADYPYALKETEELDKLRQDGWALVLFPISENGLEAWIQSVAAHRSQVSTFWHQDAHRRIPAYEMMRQAISDYCQLSGGVTLWQDSVQSAERPEGAVNQNPTAAE